MTSDLPDTPPDPHPTERRHPALIAAAVALPVALVVGVIAAAVIAGKMPAREPVALGTVPAPGAQSPECAALLQALPGDLGDFENAELAMPAPPSVKAWQRREGGDPVVLRCGLDRPLEFNRASPLQVVDGVSWFQISGTDLGMASSTWFAVDRGSYVALTVPDGTGPTPLQDVSDAISAAMPPKPIDPAEVR